MKGRDLTGRTFGRWKVLHYSGPYRGDGRAMWWCRCECGHEWAIPANNLTQGNSRGCLSCAARERNRKRAHAKMAAAMTAMISDNHLIHNDSGTSGTETASHLRESP